jgi:ribosomal protein L24E
MNGVCAFCSEPAEGNYSVHRDGFCEGPEVELCDACGKDVEPTLADIWSRISQAREAAE